MRAHITVFAVYVALAIIFTLPISLSPASALLGDGTDNYQHAWFLWHFAKAITSGHNPFHTDFIFYPFGVNLAWSTSDPLAGLLALPLSLAAGPAVAYNLSIILQLALAAFFAWLLCLRVTHDPASSAIGGMIFGFSPVLLAQAFGHLSLVTAFPLPLYLLALDRLLREQQPSWKDGAFLGACLLLTALANYNYTLFCLMFTLVVLVTDSAVAGAEFLKKTWKPLALAAAVFLAGFAPLMVMLVGDAQAIPRSRPAEHLATFSADLLGFFVPGWSHWLLGSYVSRINRAFFVAGYDGTVFVGYLTLCLACIGLLSARDEQRRWATRAGFAAALFFVLSLGPAVRVLGKPVGPGPAILFYKLPFMRFVSAPARFHIMTALCLALLASIGLKVLSRKMQQRRQRIFVVALAAGAIVFECLTVPFPHSPAFNSGIQPSRQASFAGLGCPLPPTIHGCSVLTLPLFEWPYSNRALWGQAMSDGRYRLIDGYVSYAPEQLWDELFGTPILHSLLVLQGSTTGQVDVAADRRVAQDVVHKLNLCAAVVFDSPQSAATTRYIQDVFGSVPRRTGDCTVFEIPREERTTSLRCRRLP